MLKGGQTMKKIFKLTSILLCIIIIATYTQSTEQRVDAATVKISNTSITLTVGKTQTLRITGTKSEVTWSSSNKKIAKVSKTGKVTAVSKGSAVITAKVDSKKYTCKVTVKAKTDLSDDWKSLQFKLNGKKYSLLANYSQFKNNGWDFDLSDYSQNGYSLNSGDKTYGVFDLQHNNFDSHVSVGFINTDSVTNDIKNCKVWSIEINNRFASEPVSFELPGGIKYGSTLKQVEKAYGKPDDGDRSDELGYWIYIYSVDFEKYFTLEIDDKKGVIGMSMQIYD